jgi:hypothetical protein
MRPSKMGSATATKASVRQKRGKTGTRQMKEAHHLRSKLEAHGIYYVCKAIDKRAPERFLASTLF